MTTYKSVKYNISGADLTGLTAGQIPNLATSKITTGTMADARISAGSVTQHVTAFDDNKIVNDLGQLALHQSINENKAAYSLQNSFVDTFQDDTGIAAETTCDRNSTGEYMSSVIAGAATAFDYAGVASGDRAKLWRLGFSSGNNSTWYTIGDGTNTNHEETCWNGVTETGGNLYLTGYTGVSTGSTSNYYMIFDFTNQITWTDRLKIGKNNTWGDASQWRVQYSTDNVSYTDIDFTGTSQVSYFDGSGGAYGQFTSGASGGLINVAASNTGNTWATWTLIQGMPTFTARYFKYFNTAMHSSANTNVGFADFVPYKSNTTVNAAGNFTSVNKTANSTINNASIIVLYTDNGSGASTLNTDLVAAISSNGGTNYTNATLVAKQNFATGIKMAVANDVTIATAQSTSMKYKISFANQASGTKETQIKGVALLY